MPQILMMNHASWVNHQRSEKRSKVKTAENKRAKATEDRDPVIPEVGKRVSEMTTDEYMRYWNTNPIGG
jgi:hypothetical protein